MLANQTHSATAGRVERWPDVQMVSAMRLVLALSALVIIYIDPSKPGRLVRLVYAALILYTVYSAIIYLLSLCRIRLLPLRIQPWLDLVWYMPLIGLSSGAHSVFFFFFFFAILVASFGSGFRSGVLMSITSAVLFTIVGYATVSTDPEFQLNRFLLRPISLLVLGYMIAYWGAFEMKSRHRLGFLKDVTSLSNPRFGIDRTISWIMERVRSFYDADTCLLILRNRREAHYQLRRVDRKSPELQASSEEITEDIARLLLLPSHTHALIHRGKKDFLYCVRTGEIQGDGYPDCPQRSSAAGDEEGQPGLGARDVVNSSALTNILGAKTFISVPIYYRCQSIGRLYIIGGPRRFNDSDVDFILQLIAQATPLLDNITLVDHLALDAAEQERQKIARDIHDSVIQPYIGLQFGLAAIRQRLETGNMNVMNDIKELLELTNKEIVDLRRYMKGLRSDEHHENALLPALRRFATKFSVATGIEVGVKEIGSVHINDRLAAEVFQMVTEGLSNVRRHTHAPRAEVEITCHQGNLVLQIINETVNGSRAISFRPWSIAERAEALGGELSVWQDENNRTVLSIQIPL